MAHECAERGEVGVERADAARPQPAQELRGAAADARAHHHRAEPHARLVRRREDALH